MKYVRDNEACSAIINQLRRAEGAPVRVGELIEALYYRDGDSEPDYANNCVRLFIFRLRRAGFPIKRGGFGYCWAGTGAVPMGNLHYDPTAKVGDLVRGRAKLQSAQIAA